MHIYKKWILPSEKDGNAFMIRALKAEEYLKRTLDVLEKIGNDIPHSPASKTKEEIYDYLKTFKM